MPPERVLAEHWSVARMTVRQAIAALAREGLVRSIQRRRNLRAPNPLSPQPIRRRIRGRGTSANQGQCAQMKSAVAEIHTGENSTATLPATPARMQNGSPASRRVFCPDSLPSLRLEPAPGKP